MGEVRDLIAAAAFVAAAGFVACTALPPPAEQAPALRLLGGATLARTAEGPLQHFGGISGLDRDPVSGVWFLLSDDRSARAPARLYRAEIDLDAGGIRSLHVAGAVALRQPGGSVFPGTAEARPQEHVPDPEALRIDPLGGELVWASEGDRRRGNHPFVRSAGREGGHVAEWPLPANLQVHPDAEAGARDNLSIEGLAFTPDGAALWVAMEGPLYEDGPLPTLQHGGFARFTQLDWQGRVQAQYAYPLDPVPQAPSGGQHRADNGVSEILALDAGTLLVVERSGREVQAGEFRFAVRLYEARVGGATDVRGTPSLRGAGVVPMPKRLLLDLSAAGLEEAAGNVEAAAWGPRLPNGNATLLLVSDDNFHPGQATRFLAFEVLGR